MIVGSGLAGWTVAREFRKLDATAPITLISRDSGDYYSKPMLSNALAAGKGAQQLVNTAAAAMATQLGVRLLADTEVHALRPAAHSLSTSQGAVAYRSLVLAVGADPVRLPLQGDAAAQVLSVNDLADYARFRQQLDGARRVAVIGAGLIGCEFANDLVAAGYAVEVIDPGTQPLGRLLPAVAGERVRQALEQAGVRFHFGTSALAVHRAQAGYTVDLANGQQLSADLVLSAVGLRPRTALAEAAGLQTARGIVVNRQLQSSQPDVYAVGDVAEVEQLLLPYVMPLMQAARTLAAHLAGTVVTLRYPAMPVVVKTPAIPVVVAPPPVGAAGAWHIDADDSGVTARFLATDARLLGFALVGQATAQKAGLQKAMPALLG